MTIDDLHGRLTAEITRAGFGPGSVFVVLDEATPYARIYDGEREWAGMRMVALAKMRALPDGCGRERFWAMLRN